MKNLFSYLGFANCEDLFTSLFPSQAGTLFIPATLMGGLCQYLFGINPFLFVALFCLIIIDLISGLVAIKLKDNEIPLDKLVRVGVMMLIWFTLLLVLTALIDQYHGTMGEHIGYYMHSTLIFYVYFVYFKSILKNAEMISEHKINAKKIVKDLFKFK